jgi:orotidine-5'-phosphate decarboxylase
MGRDAVTPFLDWPGRCAFVLVRTSNPGATDLQDLIVDGKPLYLQVAAQLGHWAEGRPGTVGLVVGATDLDSMSRLRTSFPDAPFLVPGVGAQGGKPEEVVAANKGGPILVNSSRQILYASDGDDYAAAAGREAHMLAEQLRV